MVKWRNGFRRRPATVPCEGEGQKIPFGYRIQSPETAYGSFVPKRSNSPQNDVLAENTVSWWADTVSERTFIGRPTFETGDALDPSGTPRYGTAPEAPCPKPNPLSA